MPKGFCCAARNAAKVGPSLFCHCAHSPMARRKSPWLMSPGLQRALQRNTRTLVRATVANIAKTRKAAQSAQKTASRRKPSPGSPGPGEQ